MSNYSLDQLILDAVQSFNETSYDMDELFEQGTQLEILSDEGNNHVKESIISTLEIALNEALINSRKLLTEKSVVTNLRKYGNFSKEILEQLSERAEKLQQKYQESYKEVVKLESLLNSYKG